jgi:PAS domain S-box-containing protein
MEAVEPVQPRVAEKSEMGLDAPLRSGLNDEVRAEHPLRLTLDCIPALLHTAEPDGSLDYFNQRWLDYLGGSLDDVKGWGWTSTIHPDDVDALVKEWRSSLMTGEPLEAEARVRRQDGVYRWMVHRKVPLRDEQGKVVKWYGSSIDIDEMKRSEFYLAEGQRLSHVGSWAFNPAGFEHWSSELFKIHGLDASAKAPSLEEYLALVHPEDRESVLQTIQKMSAEGRGFDFTKRIVRPDGEIRTVRCVGVPSTRGGPSQGFIGTGIDITEQEELTQELRRREAYLAEAQKLSHTGSFGWKPDTGEVIWSAETYRIFEYDRAVTPTIDLVAQRVHPEDRADFQSVIKRASEGASDFEHAYRLLLPDGRAKHVHALAHATQDASGNREFVGAVTDFTDQKRAQETLRESEAYLAEAQRLSQTGSWAWSPDQDIRYWSEECYRVLSFDPHDGLPRFEDFFQRIHPDDQPGFRELIQTAIREKAEWEADYRIVHPGGAVRDIHVVSHPVLSTSGHLLEFVGTVIDVTEQRQARAELEKALAKIKKSEDRLRVIIDTIPTMAWVDRPDGSAEFLSRGWLDYTGLSIEQALNWGWTVVIHSEDSAALMDKWLTSVATGKPFEAEARFRRADGKYRWCLCRGVPLRDETGNIIQWHGTTTDIEDRKRAEEELRTSERKYRHLVDTTPAFIHTASPDGALDFLSRGWLEYGGLTLTDLKDWRWTATIHPEDVEGFVDKWRAALESGEPFEAESRVRRADGEYCWFLQRNVPLRDETGKIVKWYGTGINITERKRAEEAVRRSEAFLAEGQRLSKTGSFAWSPTTDNTYYSEECYRVLGFEPQGAPPRFETVVQRIHPDDQARCKGLVEKAIRDKGDVELDYRIVHPDKRVRDIHCVGHVVLDRSGELFEIVGTVIDITERKRAEAALQEARAELERVTRVTTLGELAASIAHEINQPLAGVVTSANAGLNWLAANPPNLSKTRETLERIVRDGTRGGEVLARIRALLKRTPSAKILVSVNQIVRDVLALAAGELRQHQIELSLELATTLPPIRADNIQLQQVLLNLIKNAVEAMSGIANGQRTLRIQSRVGELDGKPAVVVEVCDTGAGFSGSDGSRLFEAFHTTKPHGMGMGLWISRSIIENHHGRLTGSPNHGRGATFVIMLPKASQEQA